MKNDKIICAAAMLLAACVLRAEVAQTNGYTWTYRVQNGKAIITDFTPEPTGRFVIPASLDGYPVEELGLTMADGNYAYPFSFHPNSSTSRNYYGCTEVVIPEGVRSLNDKCFENVWQFSSADDRYGSAATVSSVALPSTLRRVGAWALCGFCGTLETLVFREGIESLPLSALPGTSSGGWAGMVVCPTTFKSWVDDSEGRFRRGWCPVVYLGNPLTDMANAVACCSGFYVTQRHFDSWMRAMAGHDLPLGGFLGVLDSQADADNIFVSVLSGGFRKGNPRVYDLVYRVNSALPQVKVRALGVVETRQYVGVDTRVWPDRNIYEWKVTGYVRPSQWIEGTAANVGDSIRPNADHKLSWRLSDSECEAIGSGARLRVQVMAVSGELVPFHAVSLPSTRKMVQDDSGNMRYAGAVAMSVSMTAFTNQQLKDALFYLYAAGDDGVKDYLPVYRTDGYDFYFDAEHARELVAKGCGYTCLSELELSNEDRAAIWNRLNEVFFRSRLPLYTYDRWNGSTSVGIDPFVKFE